MVKPRRHQHQLRMRYRDTGKRRARKRTNIMRLLTSFSAAYMKSATPHIALAIIAAGARLSLSLSRRMGKGGHGGKTIAVASVVL